MKPGDLVELSSYGKKVKTIRRLRKDRGLVLSCCSNSVAIMWSSNGFCYVNRRDVKKTV